MPMPPPVPPVRTRSDSMTPTSTYSPIPRRKDFLPEFRWAALRWGRTTTPTRSCTGKSSDLNTVGVNDPNVDILTYSQAKGLFAGVSLGSASMGTDNDANKELYGKEIDAAQIVRNGAAQSPAAGKGLVDELNRMSAMRK